MTLRISFSAAALLLGTACATTAPAPSEKAESSSGAIRAAEEVGATHSPDAALYLQLAKEEFGHAKVMTEQKKQGAADRLLLRAQADAELSLALARNESEKADAMGAIAKLKTLKESATQ